MALLESGGASAAVITGGVDPCTAPLHIVNRALPHGSLGHYRASFRFALINAQAANSRLFEMRNPSGSTLVVPTRLTVKWLQTAAHTAAIEDSIDFFKATSFTAVDTTNTVTPAISSKRASMAAPGAVLRHVTVAGAAAGMTGGTLTKDGVAAGQVPKWMTAAVPTSSNLETIGELLDLNDDTHHWVFAQNEGFILENRVLLGAAAGSALYVDFSWAELPAY